MAARAVPIDPIRRDQDVASATTRAAGGPVFVPELAQRLGYSPDYFRRHIDRLIIEHRMPTPLPALGWKRWDRARIEAWLAGRPVPQAANDIAPSAPAEDDIAAQRALLHQAYGRAG
jgi:predicted DNA-binding transcriptional regulator AlpA